MISRMKYCAALALAIRCFALFPLNAHAQCDFLWRSGDAQVGAGGEATCSTIWDPDGAGPRPPLLVVGGYFNGAGGKYSPGIAAWNGVAWQSLGGTYGTSAVTVYRGELYRDDGYIQKWNGLSWVPISAGTPHYSLAMIEFDGQLVVAGDFQSINGISANNIASWDGASWKALGSGITGGDYPVVYSLAVYENALIASGFFTMAGGISARGIARWNGSEWEAFGGGVSSAGGIGTSIVRDGALIVGGIFNEIGGVSANNIAQWTGSSWHPMGAGLYDSVTSVTTYRNEVIAGGGFDSISRWTGTSWEPIGELYAPYPYTMCAYRDELFVCTPSIQHTGLELQGMALWNGTKWRAVGDGINAEVRSLEVSGNELFVGGDFYTVAGRSCRLICRSDGPSWLPVGVGSNSGFHVASMINFDGRLIAGGPFTRIGGINVNGIASWNGTTWSSFPSGSPGEATAFATYQDKLIVGTSYDGVHSWDGSSWHQVGSSSSFDIRALTVYAGDIIAGGELYTSSGGVYFNHIAKWNGSTWQPLGTGLNWHVNALTVYSGELIVGGEFTTAGGLPANRIAKWNGSVWQPLGTGFSTTVTALVCYDGQLFAGRGANPATSNPTAISAWNGSTWLPKATGIRVEKVSAFCLYRGSLYCGGKFWPVDGNGSPHYLDALVPTDPQPVVITQQPIRQSVNPGQTISISVTADACPKPYYQWRKDSMVLADGGRISGAVGPNLTITGATLSDVGRYDCVVDNGVGSVTSRSVGVKVGILSPTNSVGVPD